MRRLPHVVFLVFAIMLFAATAAPTCAVEEWTLLFDAVIEQKVDQNGNVYALLYAPPNAVEVRTFDTSGRLLWASSPLPGDGFVGNARFDFDAAGAACVTVGPAWPESNDVVTTKVGASGRQLWTARFAPDPGWHIEYTIMTVDRSSGAVYVVSSMRTDAEEDDTLEGALATIKYTVDGRQAWVARYRPGAASVDIASEEVVAAAPDGGVVVAARFASPAGDVLLKYDTQGTLQWTRGGGAWPGPDFIGWVDAVAIDQGGATYTATGGDIRKYAPTGEPLWTVPFAVTDFAVDGTGNVYVTGGRTGLPVTTRKYGPSGEQIWSADYFAADGRMVNPGAIAVDEAGGVYVLIDHVEEVVAPGIPPGWAYTTTALATVKYGADSARQWLAMHAAPPVESSPIRRDAAVDAQGRVYVLAGGLVIKYAQVEYGGAGH